jgi:pyruvate dehydrogenase phosphatase
MRRAALQILRPAIRRPLHTRRILRSRSSLGLSSNHHAVASTGLRSFTSRRSSAAFASALTSTPSPLMQFRLSATLIAAAVAGGAWYYNAGQNPLRAESGRGPLTAADIYSDSPLATGPTKASAEAASQSTRKALVVEDGQLYSGTVVGEGPLSKESDDYGRKVLEMLTPEQATLRLRKNEESWFVGRGKGVTRYDVVQIPSNDPIEDDHAEKIIQVPDTVAATEDGSSNSDWMFWGVFDGHR